MSAMEKSDLPEVARARNGLMRCSKAHDRPVPLEPLSRCRETTRGRPRGARRTAPGTIWFNCGARPARPQRLDL
jgi:hypothetical protein